MGSGLALAGRRCAQLAERAHVLSSYPRFVSEGIGFWALRAPEPGTVAVHRLYDAETGVHRHLLAPVAGDADALGAGTWASAGEAVPHRARARMPYTSTSAPCIRSPSTSESPIRTPSSRLPGAAGTTRTRSPSTTKRASLPSVSIQ